MTKHEEVKQESKLPAFGLGVLVGLLFAGVLFLALKHRLTPAPVIVVQTVTVQKVVTKTVVKEVPVPTTVTNTVTNTVKEVKLYKAQLLDANGNVIQEWEVTKCKFRVIGATLTDKDGHTFSVTGNIKIRPIKDATDAPVSKVSESQDLVPTGTPEAVETLFVGGAN